MFTRRQALATVGSAALATLSFAAATGRADGAAPTVEAAVSPGGFTPVSPVRRVFDSRNFSPVGLTPGTWYTVGTGVVNENIAYVTLTVTKPFGPGFITVNNVQSNTGTSYLNWGAPDGGGGPIISNSTFVPIDSAGTFYVIIPATIVPLAPAHIIVDLLGYIQR